jgi:lipopolysaccharide transport system ATP-binding protein
MSNNIVISIREVSKQYRLGIVNHSTLQRDLQSWWARIRRREDPNLAIHAGASKKAAGEYFWALSDVNLDVRQGEVLGIIGRNGAGKSTLLKILSQITSPTRGEIKIKGRIASLLEVGTGFHPELTGRENIYLNGAILGMTKEVIRRKLDEIIAFSEIERFIDTPVKRYSSGMYVRLAFAVAAHLDADVLIVDEVLAVGDVQFQKKCLQKMELVSRKNGRTVLFVSHNMATLQNLCTQGVLLEQGRISCSGTQTEVISRYLNNNVDESISFSERKDRRGSGEIIVTGIRLKDVQGNDLDVVFSGQDIDICFYYEKIVPGNVSINAGLTIKTQLDVPVFSQTSALKQVIFKEAPDKGIFVCRIKKLPLPASIYRLSYSLIFHLSGDYIDGITDAAELTVIDGDYFGSGLVPPITHGVCLVDAGWRLEQ